jgi:hypothetical protein
MALCILANILLAASKQTARKQTGEAEDFTWRADLCISALSI